MSEAQQLNVGDIVRIKDPSRYLAEFARKIRDRDAVVVEVGPDRLGQYKGYVRLRFLKRNGRGKEFVERIWAPDLVRSSGAGGVEER